MTAEEFLTIAKERYGSRGVRQAKMVLTNLDKAKPPIPDNEMPAYKTEMMEMWLDSKEEAKKFTPKKYREEGIVEGPASVDFQAMPAENEFH